jgi:hypothetical protein
MSDIEGGYACRAVRFRIGVDLMGSGARCCRSRQMGPGLPQVPKMPPMGPPG